MKRAVIVPVALVALAAAGYVLWLFLQPIPHLLPGIHAEAGEMVHVEEAQYYKIDIAYPDHTPLYSRWRQSADAHARQIMETWLISDSAQFKTNIAPDQISGPEKESLDTSGRKYEYDATYKQYTSADGALVSYEYDIYMDTGGAHPNGSFQTFTFDRNGNTLTLADLFKPGSDYLTRISAAAQAQVESQLAARLGSDANSDIFADGLTSNADNFSNWMIDGDSLVLLIPPYQAAPYAAGSFEVRIPLASMADILLNSPAQ